MYITPTSVDLGIYNTRSELASLALSLYVCLSGMDDIIFMHCTCTVLYQGP